MRCGNAQLPAQNKAHHLVKLVAFITTTQFMPVGGIKVVAGAHVVILKQRNHTWCPELGYGKYGAFKAVAAHVRPGNMPADIVVVIVALRVHKTINRNYAITTVLVGKYQARDTLITPPRTAIAELVKIYRVIMLFLLPVIIAVQRRLGKTYTV